MTIDWTQILMALIPALATTMATYIRLNSKISVLQTDNKALRERVAHLEEENGKLKDELTQSLARERALYEKMTDKLSKL